MIARKHPDDIIREAADAAEPPDKRPVITLNPDAIHEVATEAETTLITAQAPIFQQGKNIVIPVTYPMTDYLDRETQSAGFKPLTAVSLRDHLARHIAFSKWDARAKKAVPCPPPGDIAEIILSRSGEWTFPIIAGVISTPTLRADGSLLSAPGYDPATRLYLALDPAFKMPSIPTRPTRDDAREALKLLDGLLDGFPFVSAVDRAIGLSGMISPVVRAIVPKAPLHAWDSPVQGTGKSHAIDLCGALASGRHMPVISSGGKEDELEKRLTMLLMAGMPLASIDNCNGVLGGEFLAMLVERPLITVRKFGRNDVSFEIEARLSLYANGLALRLRDDMVRRTVRGRLDANLAQPWNRKFKFDPVDVVLKNRGRYVAAALTVVRAYMLSGDGLDLTPLLSFNEWDRLVRSPLVWLDQADPVDSIESTLADDPVLSALKTVMVHWAHLFGDRAVTVETVIESAKPLTAEKVNDSFDGKEQRIARSDLYTALLAVAQNHGRVDNTALGIWLRGAKDRPVEGVAGPGVCLKFVHAGKASNAIKWSLESSGQPGTDLSPSDRELIAIRTAMDKHRRASGWWPRLVQARG